MELQVYAQGREVGTCRLHEEGLYWRLDCSCTLQSDTMVGLYGAGQYLGLPERAGNKVHLNRRVSKASLRGFPPQSGTLLLLPRQKKTIDLCGKAVSGFMEEEDNRRVFRIPFHETEPHPCMQMFCFFRLDYGFWTIFPDEFDTSFSLS